jgi:hypothetical protein
MAYLTGDTGSIDYDALLKIRNVFLDNEPLVTHHDLDGRLDPQPELNITVDEGFGSSPCGRFDISWTQRNYYNFHHTEPDGVDCRFDRHPEPNIQEKHFHEPPDANSRVPSCIEVEPVELVTLAVIKCWRTALRRNDPSLMNSKSNPP